MESRKATRHGPELRSATKVIPPRCRTISSSATWLQGAQTPQGVRVHRQMGESGTLPGETLGHDGGDFGQEQAVLQQVVQHVKAPVEISSAYQGRNSSPHPNDYAWARARYASRSDTRCRVPSGSAIDVGYWAHDRLPLVRFRCFRRNGVDRGANRVDSLEVCQPQPVPLRKPAYSSRPMKARPNSSPRATGEIKPLPMDAASQARREEQARIRLILTHPKAGMDREFTVSLIDSELTAVEARDRLTARLR